MFRVDYKWLHALAMVIHEQSFEKAAEKLCISQSAVSQRIKALEEFIAHPVVVRGQPIELTAKGQLLLSHYKKVQQLESELLPELLPDAPSELLTLNIAVNADSVATWFFEVMTSLLKVYPIELNLLIDNETRTAQKLKSGEAIAAVSSQKAPLPGYQSFLLGQMEYILVGTEQFRQRHFADGITAQALTKAPGVSFDPTDDMHIRFIEHHYGLPAGSYPRHTVRSSEAFVALAKQGVAYTLLPKLQIANELKSGELINLLPEKSHTQTLYWHCWVMVKGIYKKVSQQVVEGAKMYLD